MMDDASREFIKKLAGDQSTDQALAAMQTMAKGLAAFYHELRERGISPEQALTLTQTLLMGMIQNHGKDKA